MGTYRSLLVCLLLFAVSSAQETPNKQFTVEGIVVNSATGKPLPRVLVQLNGRFLLTGQEGEFSFDKVDAGQIQINLTKPGYFLPGSGLNHWSPNANRFTAGSDLGKLRLKLAPEAVVFGRVTGQDDEPLEGAGVQILDYVSNEGRKYLAAVGGEVRTDEDGNFRIANLSAGRYYVAVKAGNVTGRVLGARTSKSSEAYPPVIYYPGTADRAAMTPLDLVPGQKAEASFSLTVVPAYKVSGRVVAVGDWGRINPPMLIGALDQPLFSVDEFDSDSGAFVFRAVPAGSYTMRVSGANGDNRYSFTDHKLTVTQNVAEAKFVLRPGVNIPVVVRNEFNKPPPQMLCPTHDGGQVDCSDYPAATVELISVDSINSRFYTEYHPKKDPSDPMVKGVPQGRYMVRARPNFGGYVYSLRSGTVDLLREELVIPEDGSVAPIEVVLRDDPGTLQVALRGLRPGQDGVVVLIPSGSPFAVPNRMGTNAGNATFYSVAPGTYNVFAFDSLDAMMNADPEVAAMYAAQAATVTVAANGKASIAVDVIHVGE